MVPTIGEAVTAYRDELASHGKAAETIRVYMLYLSRFAGGLPVNEINRETVTGLLAGIGTQSARNTALTALKGFAEWAARVGYLTHEQAQSAVGGRKSRKVTPRIRHYIPVSDFPRCLHIAEATHPVDRAAVAVALFTLARQSEIAGIQLKHVNLTGREVRVWRKKRQRWTAVTISPDLCQELGIWLMCMATYTGCAGPSAMMREHPDWYLIPHANRSGGRVRLDPERPATGLEHVVKRVLDGLGVVSEPGWSVRHLGEGVHTIRRSGARALFDHLEQGVGADHALNMVMTLLDHEDRRMTQRYIGLDRDREALNTFLRSNPMYGHLSPTGSGNVIMLRAPSYAGASGS